MLSLFWGIGPAFVMYLVIRDWWDHRDLWHVPFNKIDGDDGED